MTGLKLVPNFHPYQGASENVKISDGCFLLRLEFDTTPCVTLPCSPLCFPLNYNYILGLPACYNFNQTDCINRALYGNKDILAARYHCLKPKETVEYKGKPYENTYNLLNGSGIALYFQFNRLEKEVKEEIYVINTRELIASIGGSLGLFIGFSCYTYSAFFIDKLCSYFQTI